MRHDLTDFEWSVIEPLLPKDRRGRKPGNNRRVLNGIFWVRAGTPWRDLPERYGPYTTAYNRFNRWRKAGIWDRLMDAVVKAYDGKVQMLDSSIVRVHQHAPGVKNEWRSLCGPKPRRPHQQNPRARRRERPPGLPHDHPRRGPRCYVRRGPARRTSMRAPSSSSDRGYDADRVRVEVETDLRPRQMRPVVLRYCCGACVRAPAWTFQCDFILTGPSRGRGLLDVLQIAVLHTDQHLLREEASLLSGKSENALDAMGGAGSNSAMS